MANQATMLRQNLKEKKIISRTNSPKTYLHYNQSEDNANQIFVKRHSQKTTAKNTYQKNTNNNQNLYISDERYSHRVKNSFKSDKLGSIDLKNYIIYSSDKKEKSRNLKSSSTNIFSADANTKNLNIIQIKKITQNSHRDPNTYNSEDVNFLKLIILDWLLPQLGVD